MKDLKYIYIYSPKSLSDKNMASSLSLWIYVWWSQFINSLNYFITANSNSFPIRFGKEAKSLCHAEGMACEYEIILLLLNQDKEAPNMGKILSKVFGNKEMRILMLGNICILTTLRLKYL